MTNHPTPLLWLAFEKRPHSEAVVAGVGVADAEFVRTLLAMPRRKRCEFALQFRNFLKTQRGRSVFESETVTCQLPNGVCHIVDWRLAKWLSHVLRAGESVIEQTSRRLANWLRSRHEKTVVRPG